MALRVTIEGRDREAMTALVNKFAVDVVRTTARKADRGFRVDADLPKKRVAELTAAGYAVDVIEDADEVAKHRRRDIDWHPDDQPGRVRPSRPIG